MLKNKQAFIFFGSSGSGKGTQAEKVIEFLKTNDDREVKMIETGKRFRDHVHYDSYLGKLSKDLMNQGKLWPTFISIWNWTTSLMEDLPENSHLLIDGSPRQQGEPEILDTAYQFLGYDKVHVIYLDVSREVVKERMLGRGRHDDEEEKIERRLDWFYEVVVPMLEYYRKNSRYHFYDIDGNQDTEKVFEDIMKEIDVE